MFNQLTGNACGFGSLGDVESDTLAAARDAMARASQYPAVFDGAQSGYGIAWSELMNLGNQLAAGTADGWGLGTGRAQFLDEIRSRTSRVLARIPGYTAPPVYTPPQPGPTEEITPPITPPTGTVIYTLPADPPTTGIVVTTTPTPGPVSTVPPTSGTLIEPAPVVTTQGEVITLPIVGAISKQTALLVGVGLLALFLLKK